MFNFFSTLLRYKKVAEAAYEEEKREGKKPALQRNEREFQAAAIEIMETPPSPVGRAVGLSIILLFTIAMVWSIFGRIDIYATLQGKIIPVGNVKVIEPLMTSKVKAIHVRQGEEVKAGDLLLELDPTEQEADRTRLEQDLIISQAISTRLSVSIKAIRGNQKAKTVRLPKLKNTSDSIRLLQQNVLTSTLRSYEADQARIASEVEQKTYEMLRTKNTVAEREKLVAVMKERVDMLDSLAKSGSGSRASYLERAQLLYEQRADLATEKGRLAELGSAIATLKLQGKQRREEQLQKLIAELADNEKRISSLRKEVFKAQNREEQGKLFAPVGGTVQQLSVHTVGDVLTTGQQAMVIVPKGTKLEVEANLLNKDKGFVKQGQKVRIKVETFNFTQYGVIPGNVISISDDAVSQSQTHVASGNQSQQQGNSSGPLVFPVRIDLERESIRVNNEDVKLSPGMTVMAEIKTGDRRVIEFLLSPLMRIQDESLRER
ncbi:MAG: HlyD family type I secretion periplasmic adaptor subunit [Methyloligellaceae bacterium]